ncbi:hypothetical protein N7486_011268 [Penicillium sp. IBT 16267x]|nr:hypothetical protein N7486_011268 [Penicillium sp. IBT 16267x]
MQIRHSLVAMKAVFSQVLCFLAAVAPAIASPTHGNGARELYPGLWNRYQPHDGHGNHTHEKRGELNMDYCKNNPQLAQDIIWGYQDALPIAQAAKDALTALQAFLGNGGRTRTEALAWNKATVQTFESIFGKIIPDLPSESMASLQTNYRVQKVLSTAELMITGFTQSYSPNLEIHCDDADFLTLVQNGVYWDGRPIERGGQDYLYLDGSCSTNIPMAYTWSPNPVANYLDVTVYCGYKLTDWNGKRIADLKDSAFDSTFAIDNVANDYIALTIVHETSHSWNIYADDRLIDAPCPGGQGSYGWLCITDLANTPNVAVTNANSFAYFAVAMYLDSWNWYTGFPIAI